MSIVDLKAIVEKHGHKAQINKRGKLSCRTWFTQNGKFSCQWEEVEPNITAVRNWLGY